MGKVEALPVRYGGPEIEGLAAVAYAQGDWSTADGKRQRTAAVRMGVRAAAMMVVVRTAVVRRARIQNRGNEVCRLSRRGMVVCGRNEVSATARKRDDSHQQQQKTGREPMHTETRAVTY